MAKFRNKYRIESARLQGWDYRTPGAYFITICTKNRVHHFGECVNGKMKLSTIGLIVQGGWYQIPHYNHHVRLGEFIVMPNHIHGVLILDEMDDVDGDGVDGENFYQDITPLPGSVSVMLGSFKSACTRHIRQIYPDLDFGWQERFHDHIIRNEVSFVHISNYIVNNPLKWNEDKFNNENLER